MEDTELDIGPAASLPPASGRRALLGRGVKIAFGLAVLAFGVEYVASRWSQLRHALAQAHPAWIVVAIALAAIGQWSAARGLRSVLQAVSHRLPFLDTARVYFVSQLGKYIPGSVWPIVAVTEMCRRHGVPRSSAAVAGVLALFFSIVTGGLVGLVLVVVGAARYTPTISWLLLIVPIAAALLHPRFISATIGVLLRMTRRQPVELDLTGPALRGAVGWPVVSWLLLGLQCWALVVALGGPVLSSLAPSVGGFALAYVAGTLFVPSPAGVGIREAVLGVALVGVVDHSHGFTHDKVIVVVLLSRVLLAFLDFAQAGAWVVIARIRQPEPVTGRAGAA